MRRVTSEWARSGTPQTGFVISRSSTASRTGGAGSGRRGSQRKGPAGWVERGPEAADPGDRSYAGEHRQDKGPVDGTSVLSTPALPHAWPRPPRHGADNPCGEGFSAGTACLSRGMHSPHDAREQTSATAPSDAAQAPSAAVWPIGSAGASGGARSASAHDSSRAARIARTASGSSTVEISRRRPPQRGYASASISNARRIRSAHAQ